MWIETTLAVKVKVNDKRIEELRDKCVQRNEEEKGRKAELKNGYFELESL